MPRKDIHIDGKKTQFTSERQPKNPGRKRKLPELEELVADVLGEEKDGTTAALAILRRIRQMAVSGNLRAAEILLDRAYGKPTQSMEIKDITLKTYTLPDGTEIEM